jgi:hypothetical protein
MRLQKRVLFEPIFNIDLSYLARHVRWNALRNLLLQRFNINFQDINSPVSGNDLAEGHVGIDAID